jgi:hypothetical protein
MLPNGWAMRSAGLHETAFPPRYSKNLFVLFLFFPQEQNLKDFAMPDVPHEPRPHGLKPALRIAVVTQRFYRLFS